ncbi:Smad nuclear-interacting protein 1 [Phytophthora nicotianae]|uniref:Smad nuclear-interacting protein 1 n=1 Tax=Phytophthora nicotianae TaxID=4792 RepID=A0A0W8DU91_PHYNI|nr:Smad nuclear-interacting protein 1 [Phytophthora nicotianae]
MIQEAKLQLEPATVDEKVASSTNTAENEKEKEALKVETTDEKPLGSRGPARKRGRRSTRFVDLSGITEAYDGNENDGDSSDENDDEFKENLGDTKHDKRRLQNSWQAGPSNEKPFAPLPVKPEVYSTTAGDNVREDVEAMGVLLVKLSKFVRSLAPLVDNEDSAPSSVSASDDVLTIMDLASKLENAGALVEAPVVSPGGGKRRLSLAADRDVPILLAVQSLARSNNFDVVSQLISSAVKAKMARIRVAAAEAKTNDEGGDDSDDDDTAVAEGDEEAMRIVTNLRRASAKAAQLQESKYQMTVPMQGGESPNVSSEGDTGFVAAIRANKGDIPVNIKNAGALRGVKLFNVDILLRIVNQVSC